MSQFARVDSIDALKELRVALCNFAAQVKDGLGEADSQIQRTAIWLSNDRHNYWKGQVQKRAEHFARAKLALQQKKEQKTPLGGRYSCVDEERAFSAARRRFEEAEQKLANVRRWTRKLEEETFAYQAAVQGLAQAVSLEIPNALAHLDNIMDALAAYVSPTMPATEEAVNLPAPAPIPAPAPDSACSGEASLNGQDKALPSEDWRSVP